jgi:DNA helicase-2/ATP-dependent DNA helicase PcrA
MSAQLDSYLDTLNPVQRAAVTNTKGPVLVVAGPGSGKTRVLTFRIAYLIEQGAAPWEILALTFTNKSAREMKERIGKVVGERAGGVWAGTFHSIFARILRVEARHIGYPSDFTIYDTDDAKSLIGSIIKEMNLDKDIYSANAILQRISSAKSNLITPARYAQNAELMQQDKAARMPLVYKIYETYTARCKKAGAMDFDDLLYRLFELLQNQSEVLDKYRAKFRYLMVDEFQDTNYLQYAILRKLCHYDGSERNICVVGDDAQSIYAFRGATIQNILDFESDFKNFGIQVFKLEQNYRSTSHIVQAANEVITYNRRQIQKRIWSDKGEGQRIRLLKTMTDNEEGNRVADTIVEQKNRDHLRNSDIAILYRTNAQSRVFEEYLRRYNIAYKVFGGMSFYQRKEVKDLIAYLRLVVNPNDEEAMRRVINYPRRGIGDGALDKLAGLANQTGKSIWEIIPEAPVPARTRNSLDEFATIIREAQSRQQQANAYEIADFMARRSGLLQLINADTSIEGMGRQENFNALLDAIKSFVEEDSVMDAGSVPDKSLASYLQNIALLTDFDESEDETKDRVSLMSVHSAKGLEFKSIFLVGLEEKLFPSFMSMDSPDGLDEERRLFYVAITRAEQLLTLSYANARYRFGKMTYNPPSRFLEEIPAHLIDSPVGARSTGMTRPVDTGAAAPRPVSESGSRVSGAFPTRRAAAPAFQMDPKDFKPSPSDQIAAGQRVLHLKFGEGKVTSIDGGADNRVATIVFKLSDPPEKKIMLKFAKLQILE